MAELLMSPFRTMNFGGASHITAVTSIPCLSWTTLPTADSKTPSGVSMPARQQSGDGDTLQDAVSNEVRRMKSYHARGQQGLEDLKVFRNADRSAVCTALRNGLYHLYSHIFWEALTSM